MLFLLLSTVKIVFPAVPANLLFGQAYIVVITIS